jgi:hypothetical protein
LPKSVTLRRSLFKGGSFMADLGDEGIKVDNLGAQPLLPWVVFQEAICLLVRNGGRAERGDAMDAKLGEEGLSLDSVEGHIAHVVYGKLPGNAVFRRITPIACILIWAGVCEPAPHKRRPVLVLTLSGG